MKDCVFCKIVAGELPSYKVYENDKFYAFFDIHPWCDGHTVVIPKAHYEKIWDYSNLEEYFALVNKIRDGLKKSLQVPDVDLLVMGRAVNHAHIHLLPVNSGWAEILEEHGEVSSETLSDDKAQNLLDKISID